MSADISNSPVYELQNTQTKLDGMWVVTGLGILAGLIGIGFGAYIFLQNQGGGGPEVSRSDVRSAQRKLENVRAKIDACGGADDLVEEIDEVRDRLE